MKKGTRIWTCDYCGLRQTWRQGWCYLPCVESPKNKAGGDLLLPMAGCSEKCLYAALDESMKPGTDEPGTPKVRRLNG